jgi:cytochrome bd ubiquinol oxidase subunit II
MPLEAIWYIIVVAMLAIYIVLDGFDFGAGILHLFVAKTDQERRLVLRTIGPVWNGNEVWLLAAGGLIFFAFPKAYAAGFSGFYLALMLVLWLFMLRGLSIELRSHFANPLWRSFWDALFSLASLLLAVVFGAALGNLIRGVPLTADGYFFTAFWTTFSPGPEPGILDWFTVSMGILAAAILAVHGANYLAMKTEGSLQERAHSVASLGGWVMAFPALAMLFVIPAIQPGLAKNFTIHPSGFVLPVVAIAALLSFFFLRRRRRHTAAFLTWSLFLAGLLGDAAWGLFPRLLIAIKDPLLSLTVYNSAAPEYGLRLGLIWFGVGFVLASAYTVYVHRSFGGTVTLSEEEH